MSEMGKGLVYLLQWILRTELRLSCKVCMQKARPNSFAPVLKPLAHADADA
jgi:hypothetical protein